ncbi:MAG: hypothetical protein MUE46_05650 [Xanthomonadales bacterium]|jgi:hypothetical protein|nr:hypothetical protein [Xanthomonadales bacterium]
MPDLMVRGISDALAEKIKGYAREHGLTLNQTVLELLENGLRSSPSSHEQLMPMQEMRILGGTWSAEEAQAFREALVAIERLPK